MQIVTGNENINKKDIGIALGVFDGVHAGHRAVMSAAVTDGYSAVFTFDAPVFKPGQKYITTTQSKREIIEKLGINLYIAADFADIHNLEPEEFVVLLKERYGAKRLYCGYNFRFGRERSGTAKDLENIAERHGIKVNVIPPVTVGGEPVSSTDIRKLLEAGNMPGAAGFLLRNFGFDFTVVKGNKLGRTIGIPTINQLWREDIICPRFGVYSSRVLAFGVWYKSITNIGIKPTVGNNKTSAETHIIGFDGDLYGTNPYVELIKFLRHETKFENIEQLKSAISKDKKNI